MFLDSGRPRSGRETARCLPARAFHNLRSGKGAREGAMNKPKQRAPRVPGWRQKATESSNPRAVEAGKRSELQKLPPDFPGTARQAFETLLRKGCDPITVHGAGQILGHELGAGKWRGPKQSDIDLLGRCASAVRGFLGMRLFDPDLMPFLEPGGGLERFQWAALIRLLPATLEVYQRAVSATALLAASGLPRNHRRYFVVLWLVDHVREVTGEEQWTLLSRIISGFADSRSPYSRQRLLNEYKRAKEMLQGPSSAAIQRAGKRRLKGNSRGK